MTDLYIYHEPLEECLEKALSFRNANRNDSRGREYYTWRYIDRPCKVPAYVVWASTGSEFVGAATIAPHDFRIDADRVRLGIVGDISVSASARGMGVGSQLLAYVRESLPDRVDDVLVLPNEAAAGALRNAGWSTVGGIERYARLVAADQSASWPVKIATGILSNWSALQFPKRLKRKFDSYCLAPIDSGLAGIDDCWEKAAAVPGIMSYRSSDYVRWRFVSHPSTSYQVSILKNGSESCGYVASYVENGVYWVADYLAATPQHELPLLMKVIESSLMQPGCKSIQLRSFGGDVDAYKRLGCFRRADSQLVMVGGRLEALSSGHGWFVTAGDKDV